MEDQTVLIIGGGIAGLSAAADLAKTGIRSLIIEKAPYLGGFAAQYACKATTACVKCGACVVDEKMQQVVNSPQIEILIESNIQHISRTGRFTVEIEQKNNAEVTRVSHEADAIIMATGFKPFDPASKPYGYEQFDNVITSLELDCMLRQNSIAARPSDDRPPRNIAFLQCVGSRDITLGHLWCSKICCASSLRMSRLIKMRQPDTEITFFYIDVQSFGKEFDNFYHDVQKEVKMVRIIPGDIYPAENDCLKVIYYDARKKENCEEQFDLVVLSIGITPSTENLPLAGLLQLDTGEDGFIDLADTGSKDPGPPGVFAAGTACGPMTIAKSVASAGKAAMAAAMYLRSL